MKTALSWGATGASSIIGHIAHSMGIATWAEAAQFVATVSGILASVLTFCYLCEWWWKRMWRPLLVAIRILSPLPIPPESMK